MTVTEPGQWRTFNFSPFNVSGKGYLYLLNEKNGHLVKFIGNDIDDFCRVVKDYRHVKYVLEISLSVKIIYFTTPNLKLSSIFNDKDWVDVQNVIYGANLETVKRIIKMEDPELFISLNNGNEELEDCDTKITPHKIGRRLNGSFRISIAWKN